MQDFKSRMTAVCGSIVLSACAPDAWKPDDPYEAFLNRVQQTCYYDPIGTTTVGFLLDPNGSDAAGFFIDETSRLFNGKITSQNWMLAVTSQYQVNPTDRGVQCVLAEYEKDKASKKAK